ncbi:MAG: hypothetical protein HY810_08160 [Candidatus Omnitrophica bacterium]|nr:hypothetical protein [Candidatus Omnitrophota bacterium]
MDKIIIEKFKTMLVGIAGVFLIGIILILLSILIFNRADNLDNQARLIERKINGDKQTLGVNLDELLKGQSVAESVSAEQLVQLENIFLKGKLAVPQGINALMFKQELFNRDENLRAKAEQSGIILPRSIGFEEYAVNLPPELKVQVLMKELLICEDITGVLLDERVNSVLEINFPREYKVTNLINDKNHKVLLVAFPMKIKFKADFANIKKSLMKIFLKDTVYVIRGITISPDNEKNSGLLIADIGIEYMELQGHHEGNL